MRPWPETSDRAPLSIGERAAFVLVAVISAVGLLGALGAVGGLVLALAFRIAS